MKKYLFILALILIGISSCTQENEFDGNTPSSGRFQVSADFIDLSVGSSNQQAGTITINSNEDEVMVKWISDPSFNIDTTQTSISIKGGKGVLPIKWQKKLDDGAYIPSNILFKAGVVLTSGGEEKYIPLYNVQGMDSTKVAETIKTRATEPIDENVHSIEFIPPVVNMGENGATMIVKLTNIDQALVDYSAIRSSHNIDLNETDLPVILTNQMTVLKFKWKNPDVRPAAFTLPIAFFALELTNLVNTTLVWTPEEATLSVNPAEHSVAYTGGSAASLITSNTSWTASKGSEDWFTMTPTSGEGNGTITFTVAANTGEARSATVTIIAGNVSKQIVINQVAQSDALTVEPASHSVANTGETVTSTVTSNTNWTVTKGSEDWFTMSPTSGNGNGSISFVVSANNTLEARSATVTVKAGSVTKEIVISQAASEASLTVSPTNHSVANTGETVTSTVSSNTAWTVTKGSESWFTIAPTSGNGNGEIKFTVAANTTLEARSAKVTVKAGSVTKEITITQAALVASLAVNPTTHSVTSAGNTVSSTITCNTAWTVTKGSESWFTMTPSNGDGNGKVTFTVAANPTATARSAKVTVKAGSETKEITISQAAAEVSLTVNPTSHSVGKAGDTVSSTITCNTNWTASKGSESWFTISKTSGTGNSSISFTVSANSGATRSATVTIKAGSVTKQVVITQAAETTEAGPGNVTIEDWSEQENINANGGEL